MPDKSRHRRAYWHGRIHRRRHNLRSSRRNTKKMMHIPCSPRQLRLRVVGDIIEAEAVTKMEEAEVDAAAEVEEIIVKDGLVEEKEGTNMAGDDQAAAKLGTDGATHDHEDFRNVTLRRVRRGITVEVAARRAAAAKEGGEVMVVEKVRRLDVFMSVALL